MGAVGAYLNTSKQTNKERNKETKKQRNKQTDKQTASQTDKQRHKETNQPTNKQTNKQTNEQTNKQTRYGRQCAYQGQVGCRLAFCHALLQPLEACCQACMSFSLLSFSPGCMVHVKEGLAFMMGLHDSCDQSRITTSCFCLHPHSQFTLLGFSD